MLFVAYRRHCIRVRVLLLCPSTVCRPMRLLMFADDTNLCFSNDNSNDLIPLVNCELSNLLQGEYNFSEYQKQLYVL